jgi:xanthine dehydrogenase small subunit
MVSFILNDELVTTGKSSGSSLLDFIRYDSGLTGTKAGCREGDCGACTVLTGTSVNGTVIYTSVVACLMPLANAHGRHIVTIEGSNTDRLSFIQQALVDNNAIQCGFCTPGIVMSLVAECLSRRKTTVESLIDAIGGNICRCTGYKSVERAVETVARELAGKNISDPVRWMVEKKQLPGYFLTIPERLSRIAPIGEITGIALKIAGGTDLMIQKADALAESEVMSFQRKSDLSGIMVEAGRCIIRAASTMNDVGRSETVRKYLPDLASQIGLIASEQVRNMATIGGNIVNASPIGDMSVILLALDAEVTLVAGKKTRKLPLKELFLGYKKLDMNDGEHIRDISFVCSSVPPFFNFEKVSRRKHLDIASVNSAILLHKDGDSIGSCHLSAGGVSPVPLYLRETSAYLNGRTVTAETILEANRLMQEEISPISDVRGSAEYKRLLLRQLLFAHFIRLFPEQLEFIFEHL